MEVDNATKLIPVIKALKKYHDHRSFGLEHFPDSGPVLLIHTHSLATYDISLLAYDIYAAYERIPRHLIDRTFFKFPFLGEVMELLGSVEGTRENAIKLLKQGDIVVVAPGGMRESLRTWQERYQILWKDRMGFARLAVKLGVPVVLAACPKADDIYDVYKTPVTDFIYNKFRFPTFIAKGIGPSPIPKPVRLRHFLSKPIMVAPVDEGSANFERQVEKLHADCVKKMKQLIKKAIEYREDNLA